jgi:hypothetical protein
MLVFVLLGPSCNNPETLKIWDSERNASRIQLGQSRNGRP